MTSSRSWARRNPLPGRPKLERRACRLRRDATSNVAGPVRGGDAVRVECLGVRIVVLGTDVVARGHASAEMDVDDDGRRRRSKTRKLRARCVQVTKSGEMSHGDELRQQRQFCRSTPWTLCLRPPAGRDALGIGASFGAAISRDGLAGEPSGAGPLSDAPARRDHSHRCRIRDLARAAFVT